MINGIVIVMLTITVTVQSKSVVYKYATLQQLNQHSHSVFGYFIDDIRAITMLFPSNTSFKPNTPKYYHHH